jgi:hypothetical protein
MARLLFTTRCERGAIKRIRRASCLRKTMWGEFARLTAPETPLFEPGRDFATPRNSDWGRVSPDGWHGNGV